MTERKQIEKPQRVNEPLVFEVLLNFGFERVYVGKNVAMSQAYAFWLGGRARGEDDLRNIVGDDLLCRIGFRRFTSEGLRQIVERQPRQGEIRITQSLAAGQNQLRIDLPLNARRKLRRALKIERTTTGNYQPCYKARCAYGAELVK